MVFKKHLVGERIQALVLTEYGVPIPEITEPTTVSRRTIFDLKKKARERGYNPVISTVIKEEYVQDAPRSGRPKVITEDKEEEVLAIVSKDRNGREKNLETIALEAALSAMSVWRILRKRGYNKRKPSFKPGLTPSIKAIRLQWAKDHQHWTLED